MDKFYLSINGEEKGPFSKAQIFHMYQAGTITSETFFWTEGMTEWHPVDELFPPSQVVMHAEPTRVSAAVAQIQPMALANHARLYAEDRPNYRGRIAFAILILAVLSAGLFFLLKPATSLATLGRPSEQSNSTTIPAEIKLALNNLESAVGTGVNQQDYSNLVIALKTSVATYGDKISSDQLSNLHTITKDYDMSVQLWRSSFVEGDQSVIDLGAIGSYQANPSLDVPAISAWMRDKKIDVPEHGEHPANEVMSQVWAAISSEVNGVLTQK